MSKGMRILKWTAAVGIVVWAVALAWAGSASIQGIRVQRAAANDSTATRGQVFARGTNGVDYYAPVIIAQTWALSDMTTALTTGTNKNYWIPKDACTIQYVRANVATVSSSGLPTFDVLKNGTSILSTALTIDANERSSDTAATAAVISTASVAAGDYVNFSITGAGTSAAGAQIEIGFTIP